MELKNCIELRHSCRAYQKEYGLTKEEKDALLFAATHVPSAMHKYPLKVEILENRMEIARILQEKGQESIGEASALIVIYGDLSIQEYLPFIDQEAGAATQNILLMATSLNLASCWLGIHQGAAFEKEMLLLRETFHLSKNVLPRVAIAIGKKKE